MKKISVVIAGISLAVFLSQEAVAFFGIGRRMAMRSSKENTSSGGSVSDDENPRKRTEGSVLILFKIKNETNDTVRIEGVNRLRGGEKLLAGEAGFFVTSKKAAKARKRFYCSFENGLNIPWLQGDQKEVIAPFLQDVLKNAKNEGLITRNLENYLNKYEMAMLKERQLDESVLVSFVITKAENAAGAMLAMVKE